MNKKKAIILGVIALALSASILAGVLLTRPKSVPNEEVVQNSNNNNISSILESSGNIVRDVVGEGTVLLKNRNNLLPLDKGAKVAVFGSGSVYTEDKRAGGYVLGGSGSGDMYLSYTPDGPADYLMKLSKEGIISVYEPLYEAYKVSVNYIPTTQMYMDAAKFTDTAIMYISRTASEGDDLGTGHWNLNNNERNLLKQLTLFFENVIVFINAPSAISTEWSLDDNEDGIDVDSLLLMHLPGECGVWGMADVLLGKTNPSGKLVDTYAKSLYDYPSVESYFGDPYITEYSDDIFVGYRYFETFAKDKVAYEFGFGLSYTTFDIKTESFKIDQDNITVTATVTNTGNVSGKETVQVYFSAPQRGAGSAVLSKAAIELAGFKKTKFLAPGESETVTVSFAKSDMASFDDTGATGNDSCYVLEAGNYDVFVGNSVRNVVKAGTHTVNSLTVTEKLSQYGDVTLTKRLEADGSYSNPATVTVSDTQKDEGQAGSKISAKAPYWIEGEEYSRVSGLKVEHFGSGDGFLCGDKLTELAAGSCLGSFNGNQYNSVEYDLYFEKAGKYKLIFAAANGTGANGSANVEDVLEISVSTDGGKTFSSPIYFDSINTMKHHSKRWWNFSCHNKNFQGNEYVINVPKGNVTLKISSTAKAVENSQGCVNIDKFAIVSEAVKFTEEDFYKNYGKSVETGGANIDFASDKFKGITYADVLSGKNTWDELIAQMSLDELIDLTGGHNGSWSSGWTGMIGFSSDEISEKYGIYAADTFDGPAGIRTQNANTTWLPCATMQASTWNTELIYKLGLVVAEDALKTGVDMWLAPGMNIHRAPLGGRNFEYYSEDPFVTGSIATAITNAVQSKGVGITIKHVCCNQREVNRKEQDSRISERALREIYLEGFRIVIKEANPWCLMTSYNKINGKYTSTDAGLIRTIIRGEWGYEGLIMSDWDEKAAHLDQLIAGNNTKMISLDEGAIKSAIRNGKLKRKTLEENAYYILSNIAKMPDTALYPDRITTLSEKETELDTYYYVRRQAYARFVFKDNNYLAPGLYKGTFFEYKVEAPAAGEYKIGFSYQADSATAHACDFYVNGKLVTGLFTDVSVGEGRVSSGIITLPEGVSTIKLVQASGTQVNYDNIYLSPLSE